MSQQRSTYSKLTDASAKLSHRRIFPPNPVAQPQPQGTDLHRIAAKIRELQDDVRSILAENATVEEENRELISILERLEFVVGEQQARVDELTSCLRRDVQASESIAQYEEDLGTVGEQIATLNDLIRTKNEEWEDLRLHKEEEIYQNARLKERNNHLHYEHNAFLQQLQELADNEQSLRDSRFEEDPQAKLYAAFSSCEQLSARVQQLRETIEKNRRQGGERVGMERQRRMRLECEVRLLRERRTDQHKKEGIIKGFYDEERIQAVIDDMLQKEDALRTQIAHQEEATRQAVVEWEEEMEDKRRQANRECLQREEEARLVQLEIESLQAELQEGASQLIEVTHRLETMETEGMELHQFEESMEGELWDRIRATDAENLHLQREYERLASEVGVLQGQLQLR